MPGLHLVRARASSGHDLVPSASRCGLGSRGSVREKLSSRKEAPGSCDVTRFARRGAAMPHSSHGGELRSRAQDVEGGPARGLRERLVGAGLNGARKKKRKEERSGERRKRKRKR